VAGQLATAPVAPGEVGVQPPLGRHQHARAGDQPGMLKPVNGGEPVPGRAGPCRSMSSTAGPGWPEAMARLASGWRRHDQVTLSGRWSCPGRWSRRGTRAEWRAAAAGWQGNTGQPCRAQASAEDSADEGGVDEDPGGQPGGEEFDVGHRDAAEGDEGEAEDQGAGGDQAAGVADPPDDGLAGVCGFSYSSVIRVRMKTS
jgi:hypothetical protein